MVQFYADLTWGDRIIKSNFLEEHSAENKNMLQQQTTLTGSPIPHILKGLPGHTFRNCVERQYVENRKS